MDDAWREVTVDWQGGKAFVGSNPSGGSVQIGTLQDLKGLSPMELLLAGLAGCTGVDVASILEKKRKSMQNMAITVRGRRAENHPRIFTDIEINYVFRGSDLDHLSIEHAIHLSHKKYCSASAMLGVSAKIHYSFKID